MSTFSDIYNGVISLTKRPDLVDITNNAVVSATLNTHHRESYSRDLNEYPIELDSADRQWSINYKTLFNNYRSFKYILPTDSSGNPYWDKFINKLTSIDGIRDDYGCAKVNIGYIAGLNLQFLFDCAQQYAKFGYYSHPNITQAEYTSWIADDYPHIIIAVAVQIIFKTIGFDEQESFYYKLLNGSPAAGITGYYSELNDQIDGKGY